MKPVICIVLLTAISLSASAQFNQQQKTYVLKIEKYNRMKRTGVFLTAAGVAACVFGISTMSEAVNNNNSSGTIDEGKFRTGFFLYMCTFPLLGTGIPFTVVGSVASKKYQRKLEALSVHFNITPQQQGIGLSYRF
jgi:hypothetical protein